MEYKISIKDARRFVLIKKQGFIFSTFKNMNGVGTYIFISSKRLQGKNYYILINVDNAVIMTDEAGNVYEPGHYRQMLISEAWGWGLEWQKDFEINWQRLVL